MHLGDPSLWYTDDSVPRIRQVFLNARASRNISVAYHTQCCKGSDDYPAIGTPSVVYVVYGRCNVLNDASRTNQQELEIGNTIVK